MESNSPKGTNGALIFDLDGTLVNTAGDIIFTTNYIRQLIGLAPLDDHQVLSAVGHGFANLLARLTEIDAGETERIEELRREFRRHYLKHQTERSRVYPGIREALENLRRRFDLFVLSNKPHVAVTAELAGHGLDGFFGGVWGGGALPELKPNPIGIETIVQKSGLPRSKTVMIGDMRIDIEAARNAGVGACFVSWGFGALEPGDPTPEIVIDTVEELVPAIDHFLTSD